MKKLYRKGTVHPSPQIKSDDNLLPLLPVAIISLAALLSPDDREVLAYLITTASGDRNTTSRLSKSKINKKPHSPLFHCDCFSCYTSYWVRWDSSPNRQLIHEIIDAFEDSLEKTNSAKNKKKDRRKRSEKSSVLTKSSYGTDDSEVPSLLSESIPASSSSELACDGNGCNGGSGLESTEEAHSGGGGEEEEEEEKGTVRRFVNYISEKVFGVWG